MQAVGTPLSPLAAWDRSGRGLDLARAAEAPPPELTKVQEVLANAAFFRGGDDASKPMACEAGALG